MLPDRSLEGVSAKEEEEVVVVPLPFLSRSRPMPFSKDRRICTRVSSPSITKGVASESE